MAKLCVHFSLPLGGIVNQRSSTGAEIALFVTIVTQAVMSVIENFEMRENILYHHNYSHKSQSRHTKFLFISKCYNCD